MDERGAEDLSGEWNARVGGAAKGRSGKVRLGRKEVAVQKREEEN